MAEKLVAPSADNNKEHIALVLADVIPEKFGAEEAGKLTALEVASGTGQHVAHLAPKFPNILFQPSDVDEKCIRSIKAYAEGNDAMKNVAEPLKIDICKPVDEWPKSFAIGPVDIIININMVHITPWSATEGLFAAAGQLLRPKGILVMYGPFALHGEITPESNVAFNASLKSENAEWGLRDVDHLEEEAKKNGISFDAMFDMPSNNKILVWQRDGDEKDWK